MRVQLAKWGNSTGLRVPKSVADEFGLKPGGLIELTVSGDVIELKPVRLSPSELLAKLVEEARRLGPDHETETVEWGPDRGSEIIEDGYSRGEITLEDVLRTRDARRG